MTTALATIVLVIKAEAPALLPPVTRSAWAVVEPRTPCSRVRTLDIDKAAVEATDKPTEEVIMLALTCVIVRELPCESTFDIEARVWKAWRLMLKRSSVTEVAAPRTLNPP